MTRLTTTPLAISADYADALLAARRAKSWLFFFLLIGLLAQITIFFLAKFDVVKLGDGGQAQVNLPSVEINRTPATAPTSVDGATTSDTKDDITAPAATQTTTTAETSTMSASVTSSTEPTSVGGVLAFVVNSIVYLGSILSIVLPVILLLVVLIMLVGRLIGVSHTTSAFVWAVLLAAMLFPWQLFHGPQTASPANKPDSTHNIDINDYRVPGVFYTWGELEQGIHFENGVNKVAILRYARFAGFPLLALVILFMAQAKSGRGIKYALGETEVHMDLVTTDA